jgi:transcriptional regulator with XRE-family HTH domain
VETSYLANALILGIESPMKRNSLVQIVADNIAAEMARRGMNAAQLGRDAGLNLTGVYDILSGKSNNPRLDTIQKIATALGVSPASLMSERQAEAVRSDIMDALEQLPEQELQRVLVIARAIRDSQATSTTR